MDETVDKPKSPPPPPPPHTHSHHPVCMRMQNDHISTLKTPVVHVRIRWIRETTKIIQHAL